MLSLHLVLGRPLGRFPVGVASRICLANLSWAKLDTWPKQLSWISWFGEESRHSWLYELHSCAFCRQSRTVNSSHKSHLYNKLRTAINQTYRSRLVAPRKGPCNNQSDAPSSARCRGRNQTAWCGPLRRWAGCLVWCRDEWTRVRVSSWWRVPTRPCKNESAHRSRCLCSSKASSCHLKRQNFCEYLKNKHITSKNNTISYFGGGQTLYTARVVYTETLLLPGGAYINICLLQLQSTFINMYCFISHWHYSTHCRDKMSRILL